MSFWIIAYDLGGGGGCDSHLKIFPENKLYKILLEASLIQTWSFILNPHERKDNRKTGIFDWRDCEIIRDSLRKGQQFIMTYMCLIDTIDLIEFLLDGTELGGENWMKEIRVYIAAGT